MFHTVILGFLVFARHTGQIYCLSSFTFADTFHSVPHLWHTRILHSAVVGMYIVFIVLFYVALYSALQFIHNGFLAGEQEINQAISNLEKKMSEMFD